MVRAIFGFGRYLGLGSMLGLRPSLSLGVQLVLGYYLVLEAQSGLGTMASYPVLAAACLLFLRALRTGAMAAAWDSDQVLLLGERG